MKYLALIATESATGKSNPMYVIKAISKGMKKIPIINISQLNIPTLVLIGENDKITPPPDIQNFYQSIPNVNFQKISHAAHMVMLEKPQVVNSFITQFLENK